MSKFDTQLESQHQDIELKRFPNMWQKSVIASCCLFPLVASYRDMNSHPEVSHMISGSELNMGRKSAWQRKRDSKRGICVNHHLDIHLARPSIAEIARVRTREEDAFLGANSEPPRASSEWPISLAETLLESNWILDESAEEETLSGRGESECLRKKTIKGWEAGDSTFRMSFSLKNGARWDAWQDKLSLWDFF